MTAEQATALIIAITGLLGALTAILAQARQTHNLVDGRLTELLDATKLANQKIGELRGRDFVTVTPAVVPSAGERTASPTP